MKSNPRKFEPRIFDLLSSSFAFAYRLVRIAIQSSFVSVAAHKEVISVLLNIFVFISYYFFSNGVLDALIAVRNRSLCLNTFGILSCVIFSVQFRLFCRFQNDVRRRCFHEYVTKPVRFYLYSAVFEYRAILVCCC